MPKLEIVKNMGIKVEVIKITALRKRSLNTQTLKQWKCVKRLLLTKCNKCVARLPRLAIKVYQVLPISTAYHEELELMLL